MMSSHLSLFILPEVDSAKGHVPGKLFDYLGAGNPILGLGPIHGDAANIIRSMNAGDVFSYENTKELWTLSELIKKIVRAWIQH